MRAAFGLLLLAAVSGCGRQPPVTPHPADAIPERLSAWHVVESNGRRLGLNAGVVPYDLNTPLFSDYALKLRTVWMPTGTAARYREDREFDFPVGTIFSKTFHYRLGDDGFDRLDAEAALEADGTLDLGRHRLVETRLLVRYEEGWKALPYVWNESQTEAFLEVAGAAFTFHFGDEPFTYLVPDTNQCSACHAPDQATKELRPLGPKAHQLNREFAYVDGTRHQLDAWAAAGRLDGVPNAVPHSARWLRRADARPADLARVYLDVNCAHCHNPAGAADTSALHLNLDAPLNRLYGICKPPVAVGRGTMHREAVELVRAWIRELPGEC